MRSRTALLAIAAASAGVAGIFLAATFTPPTARGSARPLACAVTAELASATLATERTGCRPAGEHLAGRAVEGQSS
jgi:hypothetical protein